MPLPLPTFDPAKHHVGLGLEGGTKYGLMISGSYSKALQRSEQMPEAFGGRPPTITGSVTPHPPAFAPPRPDSPEPIPPPTPPGPAPPGPVVPALNGPQPRVNDLITDEPGTYKWTQDDFSGGALQFNWRDDQAMFLSSSNISPRSFDRSLRTIPPLVQQATRNVGGEVPLLTFVTGQNLCVVFGSQTNAGIFRIDLNSGGTAFHPIATSPGTAGISAAAYDPGEDVLWLGVPGNGTAGSNPLIWRVDASLLIVTGNGVNAPWKSVTDYTGPAIAANFYPVGIAIAPGSIIVAFAKVTGAGMTIGSLPVLYLGSLPADTNDGALTITWTKLGSLKGRWVDSASYNGFVYMLVNYGSRGTTLQAVDLASASIVPIADFPYNFEGQCLKVMGGRLYVGGSAVDVGSTSRFAELHEVTGNSMRLVRSFGEESHNTSAELAPASLRGMDAFEGLLWFADSGGLMSYDPVNDSFYGGSRKQIAGGTVCEVIAAKERLYAWVAYGGTNDGFYRIGVPGDTMGTWGGVVTTSDFAPFLDELKDWQTLRVFTRYGGVTLEVSQNGGSSWTSVSGTQVPDGNNYLTTFSLSSVPDGYRVRLRFTLSRGTSNTGFTELVAFTLSYKRPNPPAPVNVVLPSISGVAQKGQQLWVDFGDWDNLPTSYRVQWRRDGTTNIGANTLNYELIQSDVGHTISVIVYATNSGGTTTAESAATGLVAAGATITNAPQAEFTASRVYGGPAPMVVSFTDLTSYDRATSWDWDFGDGTAHSTAQHPTHVYTAEGTYTVTLIATNSAGSSTKTKVGYITVVKYAPQAEFTVSAVSGRAPLTVAFTDLSDYDRPTSWLWDFGDGNTSTAQHPFHTYAAAGTYTVTLTATNNVGSSVKTKTAYINVEARESDKHAWSFAVVGAERVETLDGDEERYNLAELRDQLWSFADTAANLELIDTDGTTWDVELVSVKETQPVVLPGVRVDDPDSLDSTTDREAYFQLTLLERV